MSRGRCLAALGLLTAVSATASAQVNLSLNRVGSGARAAGMGDAFVAVSDDGTAASWNPAGLAQLRQPEFSLVYGVSERSLRMSGLRSADTLVAYSNRHSAFTNASLDFASAAVPFAIAGKPVTFQVGWHRQYELTGHISGSVEAFPVNRPSEPLMASSIDSRVEGHIDLFSVAAAVKLTSRLAVGAGVNFWGGDWIERSSLVEERPPQGTSAFFAASSGHRLRGRNLSLGALLTYPSWNVGLVYQTPFWSSYRVHGERHSTLGPPVVLDIPAARFRLPRYLGLGIARRLPARWMVALSLTHDQWTDAVVERIPGVEGAVNFFDEAPPVLSTTRDTLSVNVGVEHLWVREGSVVPLRLGAGWEPQGPMDPVTRDAFGYRMLSVGAGYNTNRLKFDAAVQLRWVDFRISDVYTVQAASSGGLPRDAFGRADSREWRIKVSAIYRLPDSAKLRDVARKIFG